MDEGRKRVIAIVAGINNATFDWERRIESLDLNKLNVSFSVGKVLEGQKSIAVQNLALMRQLIERQLVRDRLSRDISLETSLQDVINSFSGILELLPDSQEGERWGHTIPSMTEFAGSFALALQGHILDYAEQLQEQAQKCSQRSAEKTAR